VDRTEEQHVIAYLRRAVRDMADGFHASLDILLWGSAYPRRLSIRQLQLLRDAAPLAKP
jgi:hypothetical protein